MAEQRGGYRRPNNPAPVSGPGSMSRRTDGGPSQPMRYISGGEYGEGQEMMNLQGSAPMSQAPKTPRGAAVEQRPMRQAPRLDAPTERDDEPLTAGAPVGSGVGPEALSGGMGTPQDLNSQDVSDLKGYLPSMIRMAEQPGVPKSFVKFVRYLRDADA